jgi:hypothetical protein
VADLDAAVRVRGPSAGPAHSHLRHGLAAAWTQAAAAHERARELRQRMARVQAQAAALRQAIRNARGDRQSLAARRDQLQQPEHAQMAARLQTMPVIEQAKGIIMAQSRCGQAEAFDILRRPSQQSNVPVRDLAAQIVAKVTG